MSIGIWIISRLMLTGNKKYYLISFTAYYGANSEYKISMHKCPVVALTDSISGLDLVHCVHNLIWNWYGFRINSVEIHNVWSVPEHPENKIPQT